MKLVYVVVQKDSDIQSAPSMCEDISFHNTPEEAFKRRPDTRIHQYGEYTYHVEVREV